jgi:hypothetical protein
MSVTLLLALAGLLQTGDPAPLTTTVDSARRTVTLSYRVADDSRPNPDGHAAHTGHAAHLERMERTEWPVGGWIRGASVELIAPDGSRIPQTRLHHVNLLNFDRGQFLHPGVERLWAAGSETHSVLLPASIGVPVHSGMEVGLIVAFVPGDLPAGTRINVVFRWTPTNVAPRPVDVLPIALTVGFRPGRSSEFDVPPGRSVHAFEFVAPISGYIIGAGGHLHDYGVELRLQDMRTGKTVVALEGISDSSGRILRVERKLYGISGRGKRVSAGTTYRVSVVYQNPTGDTLRAGGMGSLAIAFVPERLRAWPALDREAEDVRTDLAHLATLERAPVVTPSQ